MECNAKKYRVNANRMQKLALKGLGSFVQKESKVERITVLV